MPRARRGPKGPKHRLAGKRGSGTRTPRGGAGTSSKAHLQAFLSAAKRPAGY